jgi:flagellar hook-length control protein FliK
MPNPTAVSANQLASTNTSLRAPQLPGRIDPAEFDNAFSDALEKQILSREGDEAAPLDAPAATSNAKTRTKPKQIRAPETNLAEAAALPVIPPNSMLAQSPIDTAVDKRIVTQTNDSAAMMRSPLRDTEEGKPDLRGQTKSLEDDGTQERKLPIDRLLAEFQLLTPEAASEQQAGQAQQAETLQRLKSELPARNSPAGDLSAVAGGSNIQRRETNAAAERIFAQLAANDERRIIAQAGVSANRIWEAQQRQGLTPMLTSAHGMHWLEGVAGGLGRSNIARESGEDSTPPAATSAAMGTFATEARANLAGAALVSHISAPVAGPDWAPALGEFAVRMAVERMDTATVSLNPKEMGPIEIQLALDGSHVEITFDVKSGETGQAIRDALPILDELMREAGLTLGETSVGHNSNRSLSDGRPGESRNPQPHRLSSTEATERAEPIVPPPRRGSPISAIDLYA